MFERKREEPVAEEERLGLPERRRRMAPGQKMILVGTAGTAALLIFLGIASRHSFFGLLGAGVAARGEAPFEPRTLAAPTVKIPLALDVPGGARQDFVACAGGLRLPLGMQCPPTASAPAPNAQAAPPGPSEEDRVRERRRQGTIALVASAKPDRPGAVPGGFPLPATSGADAPPASTHSLLGSALDATITSGARASLNRNPSMTLAKGTLPDCTLLTAVLTDQPGFLKCLLGAPVMSMDGRVVLMEAGTVFEGEYAPGVQAGQSSIFTLWSRAVTPRFVSVPLNSPGTDALGRAGTSGQVDNKWFERFAGAVFFSLFEDAKEVLEAREEARAARRAAGTGAGDTFNIGTRGASSQFGRSDRTTTAIVEEMLSQGRQVRPSLYKNQGEVIRIFVARDVDFSAVYALRPRGPAN
jgi:type IV secretion system protein VirB10